MGVPSPITQFFFPFFFSLTFSKSIGSYYNLIKINFNLTRIFLKDMFQFSVIRFWYDSCHQQFIIVMLNPLTLFLDLTVTVAIA